MATHDGGDTDGAATDITREWRIYCCAHGCVHVALDRVTLTLTQAEFYALQDLMCRASQRFPPPESHRTSDTRPH